MVTCSFCVSLITSDAGADGCSGQKLLPTQVQNPVLPVLSSPCVVLIQNGNNLGATKSPNVGILVSKLLVANFELQQGDQKATQYGMLVMLLGQEFVGNVDRPDKHFVSKSNWPPPRWDG